MIDGIDGQSTNDKHEGQIDVSSLSCKITIAYAETGAKGGKVEYAGDVVGQKY